MSKISVTLIALSALLALVMGQPKNAGPRLDICDKSLSATKLSAIQNCQQFIPQEVCHTIHINVLTKTIYFPDER